MSIKKITVIILFLFLCMYFFFLFFPILFEAPAPLYYINNSDSISHDVNVEIFDEHNVSIFNKTYLLNKNKSVTLDREVRWYLPFPSTVISWSNGIYTFNFTVDYIYSDEITANINQFETIMVSVFSMEHPKVLVPTKIMIGTT